MLYNISLLFFVVNHSNFFEARTLHYLLAKLGKRKKLPEESRLFIAFIEYCWYANWTTKGHGK